MSKNKFNLIKFTFMNIAYKKPSFQEIFVIKSGKSI